MLALADERTARRIADILAESFDASRRPPLWKQHSRMRNGGWDITMHFGEPPDEAAVRQLVALAADDATAAQAALRGGRGEGLGEGEPGRPAAGHGRAFHRARLARPGIASHSNMIGIEIEAALAFGTGHHGTTRGCLLLLLDTWAGRRKAAARAGPRHRHRRAGDRRGKALRRRVFASDIDRRAAITARDNARLNGAGNLVEAICATGFGRGNSGAGGRSTWCWRISSPIR